MLFAFLCCLVGALAQSNMYVKPRAIRQNIPPSFIQLHQHTFPYLNERTAPYLVNGSDLPDVEFDIGESYSGLLPLNESNGNLFFWFVPSRNHLVNDEVTVWLNGGPGCSSLFGFLHENGPLIWPSGSYSPAENPWSWTGLTNMVWIDQPVGTGFSSGMDVISSEEAAVHFLAFWKNFMDLFDLHSRKVYITGESYAGQYIPYIGDAMIHRNDARYYDLRGIMLYDPSFGWPYVNKQVPAVAFMDFHRSSFPLNESFSKKIHEDSASCGYDLFISEGLQFPPKGKFSPPRNFLAGEEIGDECDVWNSIRHAVSEINPCFNVYQVNQLCPILWDVLEFPFTESNLPPRFQNPYFNRTDVKGVIHVPLEREWRVCSEGSVFADGFDQSPPAALSGGPLQRVIEATQNVIVAHGVSDMILLLNGTLLTLQNLTWNGAQGFSNPATHPFCVPFLENSFKKGPGILGSWVSERGLTFCSVELSGHEVPMYQPAAAYRQLEVLLGRVSNLSETLSFTTLRAV